MPKRERMRHFDRERVGGTGRLDPRSFRTRTTKTGHRVVFACPKGGWHPRSQRCSEPMRLHSILHQESERRNPDTSIQTRFCPSGHVFRGTFIDKCPRCYPKARRNPKSDKRSIARKLVEEMGLDNGVRFMPTAHQLESLADAVEQMQRDGCAFTDDDIVELAAGEATEREESYNIYDGYDELDLIMSQIFDGETE